MIVINKGLHPHNSIAMINKILKLTTEDQYEAPDKVILPKVGISNAEYLKAYRSLGVTKKKPVKTAEQTFRDFIETEVNGGFEFDCESVML